MDSTGKYHMPGANEVTRTEGYWDNSEKPVLTKKIASFSMLQARIHVEIECPGGHHPQPGQLLRPL